MSRALILIIAVSASLPVSVVAQQVLVEPYIQNVRTTAAVIMWETNSNTESTVLWGVSETLGNTSNGTSITGSNSQIHTTFISGLSPGTNYYYQAQTGGWQSDTFSFRTPDAKVSEEPVTIVAMSDMQIDGGNPQKFNEVVHQGVMPYIDSVYGSPIHEHLDLVMIPGDLVSNGNVWSQWRNDFFGQSHPLFSHIPVYPVPGNHENDAPQFFSYFNLPLNGSVGYPEHWWYKDYSNVRVIGMDSNNGYRIAEQLTWLQNVLTTTCADTTIDFVFVQLHHPFKSELWLPGELGYTGQVVGFLEQFSTDCGKPSIHFYGHTHGYSRGQSRDHKHHWVNVATAGGNIDYWGEYAQNDYDEFVISQDEYGFVMVEVSAGTDPQFVLKRISLGDEFVSKNNTQEDILTLRKNNLQPAQPVPLFPLRTDTVDAACLMLEADEYVDPEQNAHAASQWQVSLDSANFSSPVADQWKQNMNWYDEVNTQAGDDLSDEEIRNLQLATPYWWRVRYRDDGLAWSSWSTPQRFYTRVSTGVSDNIIVNSGAETGVSDWTIQTGALESLSAFECDGISPFAGSKYFAVGALCDEHAFASAFQDADVTAFSDSIDAGVAIAEYGAMLANWNGNDVPGMALQFLNSSDEIINESDTTTLTNPAWTLVTEQASIPIGTRKIRLIIMGTRISGADNDSYFDEIFCRVRTLPSGCSQYLAPGPANGRLYVDHEAPGIPNGESWQKAFPTLAAALAVADTNMAISEIWMAQGNYQTTASVDRNAAFVISTPLKLYGGFAGEESTIAERDVSANPTILDGDIGVPGDHSDNTHHILRLEVQSDSVRIDGITLQNGNAVGAAVERGAGAFIDTSHQAVTCFTQCAFINHQAAYGAALFNQRSTQMDDCIFEDNCSTFGANAIYNESASGILRLQGVSIQSNCATGEDLISVDGAVALGAGQTELIKN